MEDLQKERCLACEGGIAPLTDKQIEPFLDQLKGWHVSEDGKALHKKFSFKNFYQTMAFVNAVAYIANQENHHPDIQVSYNFCVIDYTTHAIGGLSRNDFICAAKIDTLIAD